VPDSHDRIFAHTTERLRALAAYYNEVDKFAAAWLRELIKAGLIADGEVDTRSIVDVQPGDVQGFTQCHWFAGIGGWSYALRLAGWPDDRPVWTGSCPCQPWSQAGKSLGADDTRDLWYGWFRLIRQCHPVTVFGEQVASKAARPWLDRVCFDLEHIDYAVGPVDLPAASVGAFHLRQRLWFVAESGRERREVERLLVLAGKSRQAGVETRRCGEVGDMGDTRGSRLEKQRGGPGASRGQAGSDAGQAAIRAGASTGELAHADGRQSGDGHVQRSGEHGQRPAHGAVSWEDAEWIACTDGKARPVEPGTFPLAHGIPARVGRLRGYGNAIVPQVAAAFIEAYLSIEQPGCEREDPGDGISNTVPNA
jgi:DNA (cytosine-5)-methyltransferase 1